nr:antirestriction protein [uncultured Desulfobulbus sp.]
MNRKLLHDSERMGITAKIFGAHFPFRVEPSIYNVASFLSGAYDGGYWLMYELDNGGFYMAPNKKTFTVLAENTMSGDAFGITVCLYVYSQMSFLNIPKLPGICAEQYHRLREFLFEHPEREAIFRAID